MALGFYKILEVVRTLYLDEPHIHELPVIRVQERPSPPNDTRSPILPNPIIQDPVADPNPSPEYSHNCIHCRSPDQSQHSPSPSYHSNTESYLSDTYSSGTSTSELDPSHNLPDNFQYSSTSPTYEPASPSYYQDPEVALYLTI